MVRKTYVGSPYSGTGSWEYLEGPCWDSGYTTYLRCNYLVKCGLIVSTPINRVCTSPELRWRIRSFGMRCIGSALVSYYLVIGFLCFLSVVGGRVTSRVWGCIAPTQVYAPINSRWADNGRRLGNVNTVLLDMLELPTIDQERVCSTASSNKRTPRNGIQHLTPSGDGPVNGRGVTQGCARHYVQQDDYVYI